MRVPRRGAGADSAKPAGVVLRSEATKTVLLFPRRRAPARRRMGFLLAKETALFGTQWGPRKGDAKKPATANAVSIKRDDGRLPLRANPIQEHPPTTALREERERKLWGFWSLFFIAMVFSYFRVRRGSFASH